jgi:hypothetical protein
VSLSLLVLQVIIYSFSLWLGLYLISRNPGQPRLLWSGLGLVLYALSLAGETLMAYTSSPETGITLARLYRPLFFLPALFWLGAITSLLPGEDTARRWLSQLFRFGLLPAALLFYLLSVSTNLIFDFSQGLPKTGPTYFLFAAAVLLSLLVALFLAERAFVTATPKQPYGLVLVATLFFGLGAGLLLFPMAWLSRAWLILAAGLDLLLLGLVIAWLDAFDEGETLLPHFLRSLDAAALSGFIFGGLVILTMALGTGLTLPLVGLLLATLAAAIAGQVFLEPFQNLLDRLAFSTLPRLRRARADLRAVAEALPREEGSLPLDKLDSAQLDRLTRRALSHMGNLPRLAANPLTQLPLIEERLHPQNGGDNTLERAAELKSLLTESIMRLKPRNKGEFGASEEWRFYNALYFPYVVGLKPYSLRTDYENLDPVAQEALTWFRTYVPERTLYNWQNAAAKLIAQDLEERLKKRLES